MQGHQWRVGRRVASMAGVVAATATVPVGLALTAARVAAQPSARPAVGTAVPNRGGPEWASTQQVLGGKGTMQPGDVLKFSFPRTDLHVTADGVPIKAGFALGSWIAFKRMGAGTSVMAMGDLVLTEDEVEPVMLALQQGGVEQTALHNHVLHEAPRIMYMHIAAHGDPAKIAQAVRTALGASKTPLAAVSAAPGDAGDAGGAGTPGGPQAQQATALDLDTAGIARVLRVAGKVNGGVYQVSAPRSERITEGGMEIPASMGVATAMNFQPTGGGKAAITGDFVMTAAEVNPVIRALREHGIQVTALHNHMLTENPRLFFMHFWANGDAVTLARGLRAALDQTTSRKPRT